MMNPGGRECLLHRIERFSLLTLWAIEKLRKISVIMRGKYGEGSLPQH